MCGRFTQTITLSDLIDKYHIHPRTSIDNLKNDNLFDNAGNYNLAPTEPAFVVESSSRKTPSLGTAKFGHSFKLGGSIGTKLVINAKSETVSEKKMFSRAFKTNRCLIPANGYFEWAKNSEGRKTPYFIHTSNQAIISIAGILFTGESSGELGFLILTQAANSKLGHIHDRMPVLVGDDFADAWLNASICDPKEANALLETITKTDTSDSLEVYEVTKAVGSPTLKTAEAIKPVHAY